MIVACAVCFGQSDAPMAQATNLGILFMLGFVAVVLVGFGSFMVYLNRQARQAAAEDVLAGVGQLSGSKGVA